MRNIILVATFVIYSISSDIQAYSAPPIEIKIESKIMDETRTILISLPNGYGENPNRKYPVQYVLDGRANIKHTRATSNFLSEFNEMPQTIIVGITNINRTRDMTPSVNPSRSSKSGQANQFLDFIELEVIQYIEKNYRTEHYRTFAGHSLGGLAVTQAFIRKPELYNAYFAFSPSYSWNNVEHLSRLEKSLKNNDNVSTFFYMIKGNEKGRSVDGFQKTQSVFKKHKSSKLQLYSNIYPDETHGTIPLKGQLEAYRLLFGGWRIDKYKVEKDVSYIEKFIRKQTEKYQFDIILDESDFYQLTNYFIHKKMNEKAIEVSEIRLKYYPDSHFAYRSMADALFASGDKTSALVYINRAISLAKDSGHENLSRYFEKLESYKKN